MCHDGKRVYVATPYKVYYLVQVPYDVQIHQMLGALKVGRDCEIARYWGWRDCEMLGIANFRDIGEIYGDWGEIGVD